MARGVASMAFLLESSPSPLEVHAGAMVATSVAVGALSAPEIRRARKSGAARRFGRALRRGDHRGRADGRAAIISRPYSHDSDVVAGNESARGRPSRC